MAKGFSLEAFKEAIANDKVKVLIDTEKDSFSPEDGVAIIYRKNLNKYLEKFMCKNEEELSDFLYYKKGIFLKVI